MAQLTRKLAQELLSTLNQVREECFKNQPRSPYPSAEWERQRQRVKQRLARLPEYVERAAAAVRIVKDPRGQHTTVSVVKRVLLLIFKRLTERSNRGMEDLLVPFAPLFGFQRSYKFVERLYSDIEVRLVLHNLFILLVREEGVSGHVAGDGTGYALMTGQHYRTDPKKHGKKYVHVFFFLDLDTNLYVGYGYSPRSEMDAFHRARAVMQELGIPIESVRLDRYYSSRKVIRLFGQDVTLYLIPKENIARFGAQWPPILQKIMLDPVAFLSQYFLRNLTETANATDKQRFGERINQVLDERRDTEVRCIGVLHNVFATRLKVPSSSS